MAQIQFDASTVSPQQAFENIPDGWYPAMMTASEMKPTKDGNGSYLACEYTIQGEKYNGRKMFDKLNLNNTSAKAVEIAYQTLSAICHAVGVIKLQNSEQLHGKLLMIKVGLDKGNESYEPRNVIKGYKAADSRTFGSPASMTASARATQPNSAPTSSGNPVPPWVQQNEGKQNPNTAGQQQETTAAVPPWAKK